MKLVLVDWIDSSGGGGWVNLKDALRDADENTLACQTVGWLVAENDRYLMVAPSLGKASTDNQVCDPMQIPRCAVVGVRTLTPGRRRR